MQTPRLKNVDPVWRSYVHDLIHMARLNLNNFDVEDRALTQDIIKRLEEFDEAAQ